MSIGFPNRGATEHDVDEVRLGHMRDLLKPTKLRLVQQILATDTGVLNSKDLGARNTITESTIRDHLSDLRNTPPQIVTTLEPDIGERVRRSIPRTYFAVTEYGIELLNQVGMCEQLSMLYQVYEAADLEHPDGDDPPVTLEEIERYEGRPEADWL